MTGAHAPTRDTAPPQNEAMTLARRYVAEFIGTALLVIAGVGTAVLTPDNDILPIATAFGLKACSCSPTPSAPSLVVTSTPPSPWA